MAAWPGGGPGRGRSGDCGAHARAQQQRWRFWCGCLRQRVATLVMVWLCCWARPSITGADATAFPRTHSNYGAKMTSYITTRRRLASGSPSSVHASAPRSVPIVIDEAPCTRWNADYPAPLFHVPSSMITGTSSPSPSGNISYAGYATARSDGILPDGVSVLRIDVVVSGGKEAYFAPASGTVRGAPPPPPRGTTAAAPAPPAAGMGGNVRVTFSLQPPTECPPGNDSFAIATSFNVSCTNWRTVLRLSMPQEVVNCSAAANDGVPFSRLIYLQIAADLATDACSTSTSAGRTFQAGSQLNYVASSNCSYIALRATCRPATCDRALPAPATFGADGAAGNRTAWTYGGAADWATLENGPDEGDPFGAEAADDDRSTGTPVSGGSGSGNSSSRAGPSSSYGGGGVPGGVVIGVAVGGGGALVAAAAAILVMASRRKRRGGRSGYSLENPWWQPDSALPAAGAVPAASSIDRPSPTVAVEMSADIAAVSVELEEARASAAGSAGAASGRRLPRAFPRRAT